MRSLIFIFILYVFSLASSQSFASSNFMPCVINPKPKIVFHSSLGRLKYDFSLTTEELSAHAGSPVWGLAERRVGSYIELDWNIFATGNGYCVAPKVVNVYVGVGRPKIYVTNEFAKDSCDFNFVLRHEQAHVQTTIRLVEHFVKQAPVALELAAKEIKALYVTVGQGQSGVEAAGAEISQEYMRVVNALQKKLEEQIEIEQQKIDAERLNGLQNEVCRERRKREKELKKPMGV